MALDDRTAQAHLNPEERRALLRAFADRMLRKITAMDDPKDMPGVERAVRVAAVIERLYSCCDRAERQIRIEAPERHKLEAERATHEREAIKARVALANTLKWGEERRLALGHWWDAAQSVTKDQNPGASAHASGTTEQRVKTGLAQARMELAGHQTPEALCETAPDTGTPDTGKNATYVDYTDCILDARADPRQRTAKPPPPS